MNPDTSVPLAVVFDMDGLMLNTESLAREAWFNTMRVYGVPLTDDIYLQVLGTTGAHTRKIFIDAYGDQLPIDDMYAHKQVYLDEAIVGGRIEVKPGLLALLDQLDSRGISKAVGSSTARELVLKKLAAAGILHRFPIMVCGDEVTHGKPAPDIFLRCAELLHVPPRACVVLEDSDNGVRAAHAAGMRVIMVPDLKPPADDVVPLATAIVRSLEDVAGVLGF